MTWKRKIARKPKKALFHYTTIDGLIGIFKEKQIWATSVLHLNDKEELFLAVGIFKDFIMKLATQLKLPVDPAKRPEDYRGDPRSMFLHALASIPGSASQPKTFVCSFTEEEDQLSQWRAYCPSGCGFSIGFDHSRLNEHILRQGLMLAKCIYDEDEQRQFIDQFVKEAIAPRLSGIDDKTLPKRLAGSLLDVLHVLPVLKHNSFYEEKEWRLISVFSPKNAQIKFRAGKTALIPYCEFELTDKDNKGQLLPIDSIVVGPTPSKTESLWAIHTLLEQEGMSERVRVNPSRIPYREV